MRIDIEKITSRQKLTIAKGLLDYEYIMDNWQNNNTDFQEVYYDFYLKARWAAMGNPNNKLPYFHKMQNISGEEPLLLILDDLKNEMEKHSYELSIGSKLLHTRNPRMPIYDSKVREYLSREEGIEFWWHVTGTSAPCGTLEREKIKHDWLALCQWYDMFMQSFRGKQWVAWFDNNFPDHKGISNIKKVDFIIFATN